MLIINITTISSRLHLCSATLWSLVNQSCIADRIIVWISSEPYLADFGIKEIPSWLEKVNIHNNIEFRYTENIGPYRKIIPALIELENEDIIVYADDDVIYGEFWLKSLYDTFLNNNCEYIVATRVREVRYNFLRKMRSYNDFHLVSEEKIMTSDYIITGVGGCILMKKHINPKFYLSKDFLQIAPLTDDVWLSFCFQKSNSSVLVANKIMNELYTIEHDNFSLTSKNTFFKVTMRYGKLFFKIKNLLLGYLGFSLTNNDKSIKKVINYLDESRES